MKNNSGFTLMDLLVGVAIGSVAMISVGQLLYTMYGSLNAAKNEVDAAIVESTIGQVVKDHDSCKNVFTAWTGTAFQTVVSGGNPNELRLQLSPAGSKRFTTPLAAGEPKPTSTDLHGLFGGWVINSIQIHNAQAVAGSTSQYTGNLFVHLVDRRTAQGGLKTTVDQRDKVLLYSLKYSTDPAGKLADCQLHQDIPNAVVCPTGQVLIGFHPATKNPICQSQSELLGNSSCGSSSDSMISFISSNGTNVGANCNFGSNALLNCGCDSNPFYRGSGAEKYSNPGVGGFGAGFYVIGIDPNPSGSCALKCGL